jgi:hypothetical protein
MKQFFKFMLATIAGVFISSILLVVFFAVVIGGIISSAQSEEKVSLETNSILELKLDQVIDEKVKHFDNNDSSFLIDHGTCDHLKHVFTSTEISFKFK